MGKRQDVGDGKRKRVGARERERRREREIQYETCFSSLKRMSFPLRQASQDATVNGHDMVFFCFIPRYCQNNGPKVRICAALPDARFAGHLLALVIKGISISVMIHAFV